jgi:fibronectin type 3 domain-containing protein
MVKLNSELVKSPSFRDNAVTSGKTYTYSVSAVDVRGNESRHSETTREPVP